MRNFRFSFLAWFLLLVGCISAYAESETVITKFSPEGTLGMYEGREAIVVELTIDGESHRYAIATMNVGATTVDGAGSYGDYFIFEDANDPEKTGLSDGWHVPSLKEIDALSKLYKSWNYDRKGYEWFFNVGGNTTSLFLPAAGCISSVMTEPLYQGENGLYWASDKYVNDTSRGWQIYFYPNHFDIRTYFNNWACSVRPFNRMPDIVKFTPTSADVEGNSGETYLKAFDGIIDTKWCGITQEN